jgi:hypothetical protein
VVFDFRLGRSSWDGSKAFSKLTAIRPTISSAGREWYMRVAGLMLELWPPKP